MSSEKTFTCTAEPVLVSSNILSESVSSQEEVRKICNIRKNDSLTPFRRGLILAILSLLTFCSPISSTALLPATPSIVLTFDTKPSVINATVALYLLMMGASACFWGPLSTLVGRRPVICVSGIAFVGASIGTALSQNLATFIVVRCLTGYIGTAFLVAGAAVVGDLWVPEHRATAMSWYTCGTQVGPALGPLLGGAIVTASGWRNIFWMQAGLCGFATILAILFVPETIPAKGTSKLSGSSREQIVEILRLLSPLRMLALFQQVKLGLVALASAALVCNMYSLLTPIAYVINPRLNLTTPLQSGLFYLAPGAGYVLGTFCGGLWSDYTVRRWIRKRNGERRPQDRLRSAVIALGVVIPTCMLLYGWCLEKDFGGIPLIVTTMFIQGLAQLVVFASLNSYCLDIMQERSADIIGGNFFVRYAFGAAGSAAVLPAVESIGIGWFCTITSGFLIISCGGLLLVIYDMLEQSENRTKRRPQLFEKACQVLRIQ